jgi:hypothetical protein
MRLMANSPQNKPNNKTHRSKQPIPCLDEPSPNTKSKASRNLSDGFSWAACKPLVDPPPAPSSPKRTVPCLEPIHSYQERSTGTSTTYNKPVPTPSARPKSTRYRFHVRTPRMFNTRHHIVAQTAQPLRHVTKTQQPRALCSEYT